MKGTYWKLKGQEATITKMEEVIGVENTELVYNWFFYDLPECMWDYYGEYGEGNIKKLANYLWGFWWNLDSAFKEFDDEDWEDYAEYGDDWLLCYKNMNTDGLTYYTNPMWDYLFNNLPGVEPEVYEAFESAGLDAKELCDKIDREFKAEIDDEEGTDPYDVCMWWFAQGVAYRGSQIIKDRCEKYKQVEE